MLSNTFNDFLKSMEITIELAKKLERENANTLKSIIDAAIKNNTVIIIETLGNKYKIDSSVAKVLHPILDTYCEKFEFSPEQILSETRDISNDGVRNKNRARVYMISTDYRYYENEENIEYLTEEFNNILKKYLKDNNIFPSFGDFIVDLAYYGYRNDGVYMWDGNDIVFLSWSPDEYGCLPNPFSVWVPHPEKGFIIPPRYWEFIKHNTMTRFNHKQHIENMVMKYDNILLGGLYTLYVTWDNIHFIIFDMSESDNLPFYDEIDVEKPFDDDILELLKNEFVELLEGDDELMFEYETEDGLYDEIHNDNVLFLRIARLSLLHTSHQYFK